MKPMKLDRYGQRTLRVLISLMGNGATDLPVNTIDDINKHRNKFNIQYDFDIQIINQGITKHHIIGVEQLPDWAIDKKPSGIQQELFIAKLGNRTFLIDNQGTNFAKSAIELV